MGRTKEQLEAINKDNTNIIVSAGAGSGKTTVLTDRVIRKLKQGVHINELLILTFTNAAAGEMKERIRKAIIKEDLKEELLYIDSAYITTFDSYALSTLKKYHYMLNIKKDISIIDSALISIKKNKFIDEIFEEYYLEENDKFEKLIKDFCIKDDKSIKDYILNISSKLDLKINKNEFLNDYMNNNFNDSFLEKVINDFNNNLFEKIESIKTLTNLFRFYTNEEYFNKFNESLKVLFNAKNYDEIKLSLSSINLPRLSKAEELEKKYKGIISDEIKNLKSICVYSSISSIKENILLTKDYVEIIIDIIKKLDEKVFNYKFENDLYEFNDIANLSIKLLKENKEIRDEIKNSLNEIMIDEYQDTNNTQEEFISYISNNNVYMVGDIKQSIYRFRNANPYIFKSKYDNYSKNNGGYKIDLNKNFRSREETLDNINLMFNLIMDDYIGGADYKFSHQMIFGNTNYNESGKTSQNNNFEVYNYTYDKESGFTKEEYEIFIIANDIKEKIENKYQIYDRDLNVLKDVNYDNFVILIDRSKDFTLYKKIFEYMNIPLSVMRDEKINDEVILMIIKNIIKCILKIKEYKLDSEFKHSFISVLRSFLVEYKDEEIFEIFKNNSFKNNEVFKKLQEISYKIDSISISQLLSLITDEFDFYNNIIKIGNMKGNMVILEYLNNISKNLSSSGFSIKDFVDYLDDINENGYDIKFSTEMESSNSVKIMTIHKSKGLEYNICYYSGLYNKFNLSDVKDRFLYDNDYGIITPYFKEGIGETVFKYLIKENSIKEEISEKIRLLYVALTRAKEKMIMLCDLSDESLNDKDENGVLQNNIRLNYRSFKDILTSIKDYITPYITKINMDNYKLTKEYELSSKIKFNLNQSEEKLYVKEINVENDLIKEDTFSKHVNKLLDKSELSKLEYGLKMHYKFETEDFYNTNDKDVLKFLNIYNLKGSPKIYKEYEFMYSKENEIYHGIIDLMFEYEEYIDIIDYKLKDIEDKNYLNQLNGYKEYIENKTNKKVNIYLYSIINNDLRKI